VNLTQVLLYRDCRDIPPDQIGHSLEYTDPPYSDHVHDRMVSCAQKGDVKGVRHRDAGFAAVTDSLRQYVGECGRKAERWSAVYSDVQGAHLWEAECEPPKPRDKAGHVRSVPWIRWSSPQQSGDRPCSGCEMLVLGHAAGKMRWRGPGDVIELRHKCLRGDEKHPTEKPLDQALDIVSWLSDPGEIVHSACAGFATDGLACVLLGREYIGCQHHGDSTKPEEIAEARKWFERGTERMAAGKRGELSKRDTERLRRWLATVAFRALWPTPKDKEPRARAEFELQLTGKVLDTEAQTMVDKWLTAWYKDRRLPSELLALSKGRLQ